MKKHVLSQKKLPNGRFRDTFFDFVKFLKIFLKKSQKLTICRKLPIGSSMKPYQRPDHSANLWNKSMSNFNFQPFLPEILTISWSLVGLHWASNMQFSDDYIDYIEQNGSILELYMLLFQKIAEWDDLWVCFHWASNRQFSDEMNMSNSKIELFSS